MKKNLSFFKSQFLAFILLLIGSWAFGQTTLVHYAANGTDTPQAGYDTTLFTGIGSPNIVRESGMGFNSNNTRFITYNNNRHVEMTFNTVGKSDLIMSFYISHGDGWGTWKVSTDYGTGGAFTEIGSYDTGWWPYPGSRTVSLDLPASAMGKATIKFRITSSIGNIVGAPLGEYLELDDIKILSGNPKIKVYSNTDVHIPHLSSASVAMNTDFGTRQTTEGALSRAFRIRNYQGTSNLNISNITVTGANPGDFTVTPTVISNIATTNSETGSTYGTFTISFLPLADGVRIAEINIYSNSAPSPYTFVVVGTGASCQLVSTPFVQNTMDGGQTTLPISVVNPTYISGNACSPTPNIGRLYPSTSFPFVGCTDNPFLYNSASSSLFIRNETKELEFNPVNIANQKNVAIRFRVAAFSTANNRGVTSNDYITLSVQRPNSTSWSEELKLVGSNGTNDFIQYDFSGGDHLTGTYDGDDTPSGDYNETNRNIGFLQWKTYNYKQFTLSIPASANISNLKFKITAYTGGNNRLWLIDDVQVLTSNAVYRVWTGSAWQTPTGGTSSRPTEANNVKVVFNGNYNFGATDENSDLSICACEVNAGKTLTIPSNRTLKVRGAVTNHGNENNFIVASNANLIQIEDGAVNTGSITVQRTTQLESPTNKYLFWSSPVMGQNMFSIFSATPQYVMSYNTDTDYYTVLTNPATAEPGKGYSIKTPNIGGVSFKGQPNNGQISFTLNNTVNSSGNSWNLIGNPYPSNMNLVTFYQSNNSAIDSSLYLWNNVTATNTQQTGAGATTWVVFNASGTGTWSHSMGSIDSDSKSIRPGQGFLVKATGTSLIFNNAMRSSGAASTVNRSSVASETDGKYWIELKTPSGLPYSMAVTYGYGGRDEYDKYDSKTMGSGSSVYTTLDEYRFSIQGKNNFREEDKVPMGISIGESGIQTIRLSDTEGVFNRNSKAIILKDNLLGIETDLAKEEYTFNSEKGRIEGRFEIIYRPTTVLNTVAAGHKDDIELYRSGEMFVIRSTVNIQEILVYDLSGRLIKDHTANSRTTEISIAGNGIFLLRIQTENGEIVNKKVRK